MPVVEEFEQAAEVVLLCKCMPILSADEVAGGVLLLRDVTDLRQRDRLLMSKDATIREIHHRVKNNLQTISSLLRLQARRLSNPEAIAAVGESVRRIRTIALVHESLSREPGDDVTFIEIVRPLLRLAEESLQSPDRPVEFSLVGEGGRIPARVATPLSVVLTELLQNAVDHGFPEGSGGGRVVVALNNDGEELSIDVVDDGHGLDPTFRIESATGLGLVDRPHARHHRAQRDDRHAPGEAGRPRGRRPRVPRRRPSRHRRPAHRAAQVADVQPSSGASDEAPAEERVVGLRSRGRNEQSARGGEASLPPGKPGALATDDAALLFGESTPDARVLIRVEGELETLGSDEALSADLPGLLQLEEGEPGRPDRKEQLGIRVAAQCVISPGVVGSSQGKA